MVANKFPALVIEGNLDKLGDGLYDKMNGIGAHEVIIETPNHEETLSTMPVERVRMSFGLTATEFWTSRKTLAFDIF